MRNVWVAAVGIAAACAPLQRVLEAPPSQVEQWAAAVTIVRDEWGVPHVYGPTDASVAFGLAYAQAEDHYDVIDLAYSRVLGGAAETGVSGDDGVELERASRAEYESEPAARREVWDAFVAGLNYYVQMQQPDSRSIEQWEPWMLFARARAMPDERGEGASSEIGTTLALGAARSPTGAPVVLHSARGSFAGGRQQYEMHVQSDAGWHVRGVVEVGLPVPRSGMNAYAAYAVAGDGARAEGGSLQQLYTMSRATGLDAFMSATREWPAAGAAVTYADAAGNIMQMARGAAPVLNPASGWVHSPGAAAAAAGERMVGGDSAFTWETLERVMFDSRVRDAESAIQRLVLEWEDLGGSNPDRAIGVDDAVDLLRSWNMHVTTDSEAATLFILWQEQLRADSTGALAAFRALEQAAAALKRDWKTVRVPWGSMSRLQRTRGADGLLQPDDSLVSLPLHGAPEWAGLAFTVETVTPAGSARRYAAGGAAWVGVMQPGAGARMRSILPFGQSGDPASQHYFDQAPLYAAGTLKESLLERDAVIAGAVRIYHPGGAVQ